MEDIGSYACNHHRLPARLLALLHIMQSEHSSWKEGQDRAGLLVRRRNLFRAFAKSVDLPFLIGIANSLGHNHQNGDEEDVGHDTIESCVI